MGESLLKHNKNLGGKFQNVAGSDVNGDQYYNNIKVVEVGSEINDLSKDDQIQYGRVPDLRCTPQYLTKTYKKTSRDLSPGGNFHQTRRILGEMEESLIQMRNLMNRQGIFDKSVSENNSEALNTSFNQQLNEFVEKLT